MIRKYHLVLLFIGFIWFGCHADINVTKCEINVKQGDTIIPSDSGYFNFGNIPLNYSQMITFTIENTGVHNLNLTGNPIVNITGTNSDQFIVSTNLTKDIVYPQTSTEFSISFVPQSLGKKTAEISIASDDRDENLYTFVISGTCTLPAPEIHVKQGTTDIMSVSGSYDFGKIYLKNSSAPIIFTIENNGNEKLELTGNPNKINILGNDASMFIVNQVDTQPVIFADNSTLFRITFKPTSPGIKTAKVSILNNDSDENPYTFTLLGTAIAVPEINLKNGTENIPNKTWKYDFGSILINKVSAELTITIENLGTSPLHLVKAKDSIEIIGTDAAMFSLNNTATKEFIEPDEKTTFSLSFKPTSAGLKNATVSIENNDDDENPFTFSITGTCVVPEINVRQDTTDVPSTGSYDFGLIYLGDSSQNKIFTIQNSGLGDLELSGTPKIAISGADSAMFKVNETATTTPVKKDSSTTFIITFTPTSVGNKSAKISIANNDTDENPYTFTLIGESQIAYPEIEVKCGTTYIPCTTGVYDYSSVYIGKYLDRTFTIRNLGQTNLILTGTPIVNVIGSDAGMFIVKYYPSTLISPGGYSNFTISCTPTAPGIRSATVSIANNDTDENPYTFTVKCDAKIQYPDINIHQGVTEILCTTGVYDFGVSRIGNDSGFVTFKIGNNGPLDLELTSNPKITISGANASSFIIDQTMTTSPIKVGNEALFKIKFAPVSLGNNTATISIPNNDPDENPFTFEVKGSGVNYLPGGAFGWIGGGNNGWKTTSGTNINFDYQSFKNPRGVFVDSLGNMYIADAGNNRICKWDKDGNAIGWIGSGSNGWKTGTATYGNDYQSFSGPTSVFVDSAGYIFVVDSQNERVSKWDSAGNAIGWIGEGSNGWKTTNAPRTHSADYQSFEQPQAVFLDSSGYIYVSDSVGHRVCKWDYAGNAIGWIGGGSNGWKTTRAPYNSAKDYQSFDNPVGVNVDSTGNIYVCDASNHRVCKWSSSGNAIGWIGGDSNGWKTGIAPSNASGNLNGFNYPVDVSLSNTGNIFIIDSGLHRLSKWSGSGNAIGWLGGGSNGWKTTIMSAGYASDYQSFHSPSGVFIDSGGFLYIADRGNHRICKWED